MLVLVLAKVSLVVTFPVQLSTCKFMSTPFENVDENCFCLHNMH